MKTDLELLQTELDRLSERVQMAIESPSPDTEELVSRAMSDVRWQWKWMQSKTSDRIPFQPFVNGSIDEVQS